MLLFQAEHGSELDIIGNCKTPQLSVREERGRRSVESMTKLQMRPHLQPTKLAGNTLGWKHIDVSVCGSHFAMRAIRLPCGLRAQSFKWARRSECQFLSSRRRNPQDVPVRADFEAPGHRVDVL
jgi:hypothetical protein